MLQFEKKSKALIHSTIRIECILDNHKMSVGTGFFYSFKSSAEGDQVFIVTNKHVIENSIVGTLKIPLVNAYKGKKYHDITIDDFEEHWIFHDDKNVDLCILPVAAHIDIAHFLEQGLVFDIDWIDGSIIPSEEDAKGLGAIEEVIMIGYPDGIMDEVNMKPIVRSGITATSLQDDYDGKKEFLIDIACYGGSSGSPVFIYKEGAYIGRDKQMKIGVHLLFIGILFEGWDELVEEEHLFVKRRKFSQIILPLNLGICIKSERMRDFPKLIDKWLSD